MTLETGASLGCHVYDHYFYITGNYDLFPSRLENKIGVISQIGIIKQLLPLCGGNMTGIQAI